MEIVLSVIVIFVIIWIISTNNKITKLKNKVKQSESTMDVYLNKRFDLIPNLVECVKGYMNYEQDVLESITKERNDYARK